MIATQTHVKQCLRSALVFATIIISYCALGQDTQLVLGQQPVFSVHKAQTALVIDGRKDETDWERAMSRRLEYFYRVDQPSDQQNTTFRMLWDEENLYVFFELEDQYLTVRETERDGQPYFDDCAEIFLIPAPDSLDTHFGFELNLNLASNDFVYFNDYYEGSDAVLFAFNPEFQAAITYDGTINNNQDTDQGWTLEMAIPLDIFRSLSQEAPPVAGTQWAFLAVRQDRNDNTGNRRSTSTLFPIYDISKNVHQVNRFGLMEFVE
ncbi:MAG: carbohydrate-binding family 9-like protein [Bacteroidota bacterium]